MIDPEKTTAATGCSCGAGCCGDKPEGTAVPPETGTGNHPTGLQNTQRSLIIDFLYLDLNVCTRCQDTDSTLEDALDSVSAVLKATNVDVSINKINVNTRELAEEHRFESSPTIRIDGCDIQLEYKESLCESCGDLCGDEVDCRVWIYQGIEYPAPPKAMIVEAILKTVYGDKVPRTTSSPLGSEPYVMPENLNHFYSLIEKMTDQSS